MMVRSPRRAGRLMVMLAVVALVGLPPAIGAQVINGLSLPDNPLEGRVLFESRQCNRCHSVESGGSAPSLADGGFGGSLLDLGASLWNHVPGLSVDHERRDVPWPELSSDETLELLVFLYYIDYLGRPGVAERGEVLFDQKGCATCHSIGGGPGQNVGPDLASLDRYASPLYVGKAIWNHGPTMLESMRSMEMRPPLFDDGDLADLSAFIRRSGLRDGGERVLLGPGNPNRGAAIFSQKGCGQCHAVRGHGQGEGPDLAEVDMHHSAADIAGSMWNHAAEMDRSIREQGMPWPQFTTTELADLVAYLYFQSFEDTKGDPVRGRDVFVSRSCATCHGGAQGTVHPGPELTDPGKSPSPVALVAAMWNHAPVMNEAILEAGRPWPLLTGADLRDLLAYVEAGENP